jgi:hypothetical protein
MRLIDLPERPHNCRHKAAHGFDSPCAFARVNSIRRIFERGGLKMGAKVMVWGAAFVLALGSTAVVANVVVVKSIGPSAKAYPPGRTLPPSAKITLQGGDVITVLGPSTAQTLHGPAISTLVRSALRPQQASAGDLELFVPQRSRTTRASGISTSARAGRCV